MTKLINPAEFNLNIGWFIDAMAARGFSMGEMKCVSFVMPYHDPDMCCFWASIRYLSDACRSLEYRYDFFITDKELANMGVDLIRLSYEHALDLLAKELPKIRQVEAATKRLLGEPQNEQWSSPLTNISISYNYERTNLPTTTIYPVRWVEIK